MNYYQLPLFEHVYFEDSYVLGVKEESGSLIFDLEVVLTEDSPLYTMPAFGENYCYKRAELAFCDVSAVNWVEKRFFKNRDSSGGVDYGNIDFFSVDNEDCTLSGDWGVVKLTCKNMSLKIL